MGNEYSNAHWSFGDFHGSAAFYKGIVEEVSLRLKVERLKVERQGFSEGKAYCILYLDGDCAAGRD